MYICIYIYIVNVFGIYPERRCVDWRQRPSEQSSSREAAHLPTQSAGISVLMREKVTLSSGTVLERAARTLSCDNYQVVFGYMELVLHRQKVLEMWLLLLFIVSTNSIALELCASVILKLNPDHWLPFKCQEYMGKLLAEFFFFHSLSFFSLMRIRQEL